MIRVVMTSELSKQQNDAVNYYTCSSISRTGNCSSKIVDGSFFANSRLHVREV